MRNAEAEAGARNAEAGARNIGTLRGNSFSNGVEIDDEQGKRSLR